MDEAMRIDNWRNTKKALRQYNCREMNIRFEPESDSGLIDEEKSDYQPLQETKGLRIKFAGNKRKTEGYKKQTEGYKRTGRRLSVGCSYFR